MKKVLIAAMSLLCLGIISSCNKDKTGKDAIIGTWTMTGIEFYFDGNPISYNPNEDDVYCLYNLADNDWDRCYSLGTSIGAELFHFTFKEDGTVAVGPLTANWTYNEGKFILTTVDGEPVSMQLSDGSLYMDIGTEKVQGYQVVPASDDWFSGGNPGSEWTGYDGQLHDFQTTYKLNK